MPEKLSVVVFLTGLCALTYCVPRQYHFIDSPLPWFQAQAHCRERYTDLATVTNIEEMNLLVNTAQEATGGFREKAWIGLYDNITSWKWTYVLSPDNKPSSYRNWAFGEPDNFLANEMCVKMGFEGEWEDSQCLLNYSFICYNGLDEAAEPFIFIEEEMTWTRAQQYCRRFHTDLASVTSAEENKLMQNLVENRTVWIGLFRDREWSDQSVSTYRNWKQGQPDNAERSERCTAADLGNAGLWSDERCDFPHAFICYSDTEQPPVSTTEMSPLFTWMASTAETFTEDNQILADKYVVKTLMALVSNKPLSEDELQYMVSVQFRDLLIELGLPENIKVALRSTVSLELKSPVRRDEG